MAECRTVAEYFQGPSDHPDPDKHAIGKVGRSLAYARDNGIAEVLIEARKTDAGSSSSEKLLHRFARNTDEPGKVCSALEAAIADELPEQWNGELRLNFRDRSNNEHLGSFTKQIRGYAPTGAMLGTGAQSGSQVLVAEFDRVRQWADLTFKALDRGSDVLRAAAELVKASHPPAPPPAPNGGPMALLSAATEIGRAVSGQQAAGQGAQQATPRTYYEPSYSGGASLPWTPDPPPSASIPGASVPALPQAGHTPSSSPPVIDRAAVERWAADNPTEAEAMVRDQLRARGMPV